MAKFKLTKKDREYLASRGYSLNDIHEVDYAASRTEYHLIGKNDEKLTITRQETEERLGREGWLDALARAAFYVDTTRVDARGEKIHLHAKVYL